MSTPDLDIIWFDYNGLAADSNDFFTVFPRVWQAASREKGRGSGLGVDQPNRRIAGITPGTGLREGLLRAAQPEPPDVTAHAHARAVVTADVRHSQVELRMLEEVREELKIDRLHAAAIEWGARVRHMGV